MSPIAHIHADRSRVLDAAVDVLVADTHRVSAVPLI
jgi:hypothetical protein